MLIRPHLTTGGSCQRAGKTLNCFPFWLFRFFLFLSRTLQTNENFRVKRGERIRTTRRHSAHLTARSNYKAEEWRNGSLTQLFGTFGLAQLLLLVFAICLLCLLPLFLLVTSSRGPPARLSVHPPFPKSYSRSPCLFILCRLIDRACTDPEKER